MAWPRGGYRKPRHGAGVASRIPRDSACDSGLRPGQLAAATRHAVRLAGLPVPARSPCGPARCGLGRPRMPLARNCRMPGAGWTWCPGEALEQRLAKRAKDLDLAMNPALTASPPRMPGSGRSTAGRRGRAHTWAFRALRRGGVQRPPRSPGQADTRRGPASPEPPSCSRCGRCGDGQGGHAPPGPARPGAPERSIWRPNAPAGGQPERPQQGASQADPSLGASPADRPRLGVMWSKFRQKCYAARVFRPNST